MLLGFLHPFSGNILRNQGKYQRSPAGVSYLILNILLILCELVAELSGNLNRKIMIFHKFNMPKHNHAPEIQGPVPLIPAAVVIDAEGYLVMLLQSAV